MVVDPTIEIGPAGKLRRCRLAHVDHKSVADHTTGLDRQRSTDASNDESVDGLSSSVEHRGKES